MITNYQIFDHIIDELLEKNINEYDAFEISTNSFLLEDQIRKSFVIQYHDPVVKSAIKNIITKYFNDFKFYDVKHGLLVTLSSTKITFDLENYTDKDLGDFLEYPCSGDIVHERDYVFNINAKYYKFDKLMNIYAFICSDKNKSKSIEFYNKIKYYFENVLNKYLENKIELSYEFKKIYTISNIIDLYERGEMVNEIKEEIINVFYNHNFVLLSNLYKNEKINIFDSKLKSFIITILYLCNSEFEYGFIAQFLRNYDDKKKSIDLDLATKSDWTANVLRNLYNIKITDEDITTVSGGGSNFNTYFSNNSMKKLLESVNYRSQRSNHITSGGGEWYEKYLQQKSQYLQYKKLKYKIG